MAKNIKFIFATVLIASLVASGYAIRCFNCESDNDSRCKEPYEYSSEFVTDCDYASAPSYVRDEYEYNSRSAVGCMEKTVKKADGKSAVYRSCFWGDTSEPEQGCRNPPWTTYETLSCKVCGYYECNDNIFLESYSLTGSSNVPRSISVMAALFFAIIPWV